MPTIEQLLRPVGEKYASDYFDSAMDSILGGYSPSPLANRAEQLDKIAQEIVPLTRPVAGIRKNAAQAMTPGAQPVVKPISGMDFNPDVSSQSPNIGPKVASEDELKEVYEKYAQFEEGQELFKEAYDAGYQATVLEYNEKIAIPGLGTLASESTAAWKNVHPDKLKTLASRGFTPGVANAATGALVGGGLGAGTGLATAGEGDDKAGRAISGGIIGALGGAVGGRVMQERGAKGIQGAAEASFRKGLNKDLTSKQVDKAVSKFHGNKKMEDYLNILSAKKTRKK